MNKKIRELISALFICILAFLQSGCLSGWLTKENKYDIDNIEGFYFSADSASIIMIGEKHHYLIPLNEKLKYMISWKGEERFISDIGTIRLGKDGNISGNYKISITSNLAKEKIDELTNIGFVNKGSHLDLNIPLSGKAYAPSSSFKSFTSIEKYKINIVYDISKPKLIRYTLTPVVIAVDGTLMIGGLALVHVGCTASMLVGHKCY